MQVTALLLIRSVAVAPLIHFSGHAQPVLQSNVGYVEKLLYRWKHRIKSCYIHSSVKQAALYAGPNIYLLVNATTLQMSSLNVVAVVYQVPYILHAHHIYQLNIWAPHWRHNEAIRLKHQLDTDTVCHFLNELQYIKCTYASAPLITPVTHWHTPRWNLITFLFSLQL